MAALNRLCSAWPLTAWVILAAALCRGAVHGEEISQKRFYAERNSVGAITDLYYNKPSESELSRLAAEDFDLEKLRLIDADIGSSPLLSKLVCSPKLKRLE